MRITIIPSDSSVGVDKLFYSPLNLSTCNIPANVHALQWYETQGQLEICEGGNFSSQHITELPTWATACVAVWQDIDQKTKAPITPERTAENVRNLRNGFLFDSDWTQLMDSPLSADAKQEWESYRQQLRDITNQPNFPQEIVWPTPPQK
jgi:hypothetical protein